MKKSTPAKVVNIKQALVKKVKTEMIASLIQAIQHRIPVLQGLPDNLKYNFKVESLNIIDEWNKFYPPFWDMISENENEYTELGEGYFNIINYFVYFFGSFYKYNGDKQDEMFVTGAYIYLHETIKFVDGSEEFDLEKFFYSAFPKKC